MAEGSDAERRTVWLATPGTDCVRAHVDSVVELTAELSRVLGREWQVRRASAESSIVWRARTKVCETMDRRGAQKGDLVLWVDSDVSFEVGDFERIVADAREGRAAVAGVYTVGWLGAERVLSFSRDEWSKTTDRMALEWEIAGWDGVVCGSGFGFLLTAWDFHLALRDALGGGGRWGFEPLQDAAGLLEIGEDYAWCTRMRQTLGLEVAVKLDVRVSHWKRTAWE